MPLWLPRLHLGLGRHVFGFLPHPWRGVPECCRYSRMVSVVSSGQLFRLAVEYMPTAVDLDAETKRHIGRVLRQP
jgi:hypothetical protein